MKVLRGILRGFNFSSMSLAEIQRAVQGLPAEDKVRLTSWMVSQYPILKVEHLMAYAGALVDKGTWVPTAPTRDNQPQGSILDHAQRGAAELHLGR